MSKIIVKPLYNKENIFSDIEIELATKKLTLLGANGKIREIDSLKSYKENSLAVFLGFGFGYAIEEFLEKTKNENLPICIIDKEEFYQIDEYKEIIERIAQNERVEFIQDKDSKKALENLLLWQHNTKKEVSFIRNTQYLRLDREYYSKFEKQFEILKDNTFWKSVQSKKFQSDKIKILFTDKSWLSSELIHSCQRLSIEYMALDFDSEQKEVDSEYIKKLFDIAVTFKPDMVLTFNHLGLDSEGLLLELLAKLDIPLLSFFVDHPYLTLHDAKPKNSEYLSIFTYDKDNVEFLKNIGYKYVDYMPLGTDIERFHPRNKANAYPIEWESEISFVGSSMYNLIEQRLKASHAPNELLKKFASIAKSFRYSKYDIAKDCINNEFQEVKDEFYALSANEQLMFERAIIWEATRQYRFDCIEEILPFTPTIMGDNGWKKGLAGKEEKYKKVESVTYFKQLPDFYTHSIINFNTTSMQMKNAVNQRVFDVLASNSFVLTDWRSQMDDLLISGKEIISYKEIGEIPELVSFYLKNERARNTIIEAGRKRIIAEHSWDNRLKKMLEVMQDRYKV